MKLDKAAVARIKNATPKKQQKGASSLEYIMLAAVIIAVLALLTSDNQLGNTVRDAFTDLFKEATETATGNGNTEEST
jgi:Flp pilus assembly pilin Flp